MQIGSRVWESSDIGMESIDKETMVFLVLGYVSYGSKDGYSDPSEVMYLVSDTSCSTKIGDIRRLSTEVLGNTESSMHTWCGETG